MSVINNMLRNLDRRHGASAGYNVPGELLRSVDPSRRARPAAWMTVVAAAAIGVLALTAWRHARSDAPVPPLVTAPLPLAVSAAPTVRVAAVASPTSASAEAAPPSSASANFDIAASAIDAAASTSIEVASTPHIVLASSVSGAASPPGFTTFTLPAAASAPVAAGGRETTLGPATPSALSSTSPANPVVASTTAAARPGFAVKTVAEPALASSVDTLADRADTTNPVMPSDKPTGAAPARIGKGKSYSPAQVEANLLGQAVALEQQGLREEAKQPLLRLLAADPQDVQARQMLARLQADTGHPDAARSLLAEGLRLSPGQPMLAMSLARMQVDAGDVPGAIQTLEAAHGSGHDAVTLQAFLAALQLRVQRYDEATRNFQVALRSDPNQPQWLVGLGVALEGLGHEPDAADAYRRASRALDLTPDTAQFIADRLAKLSP